MIYRVTAVLAFDIEDEAADFYHDCELAIAKSVTINPGTPVADPGHILYQHCHHDVAPPYSCDVIEEEWTP